jgi:predicted  nucleic acid-binding Zn-ribbon protein
MSTNAEIEVKIQNLVEDFKKVMDERKHQIEALEEQIRSLKMEIDDIEVANGELHDTITSLLEML